MQRYHYIRDILLDRNTVPSFDEYPFAVPSIRFLDRLILHPKITFFIGENGTGKSTLIEAIAVNAGLNPEGGSRDFKFGTRLSHSDLSNYLRLNKGVPRPKDWYYLRAESFYNVATEIENLDVDPESDTEIIHNKLFIPRKVGPAYGNRGLHEQSHGEAFLALLLNRFRGNGLYILDEPEAALSPLKQMSILSIIHNLINQNSQFIIATHSPIIMSYPDSIIYQCSEAGITQVEYQDTEHFNVTRDFLNNPDRMLDTLLSDR
ncbi:MAG: AAA family ATPase [Armatimonadota bacterium]